MKVSRSLRIPEDVHTALKTQAKGAVSELIGRGVRDYIEQSKSSAIQKRAETRVTSVTIEHDDMVALNEIAKQMGVTTNELLVQIATRAVQKDH